MKVLPIKHLQPVLYYAVADNRDIRQLLQTIEKRASVCFDLSFLLIAYNYTIFTDQFFRVNQKSKVTRVIAEYYNFFFSFQRPVSLAGKPPARASNKYVRVICPALLVKTFQNIGIVNTLYSRIIIITMQFFNYPFRPIPLPKTGNHVHTEHAYGDYRKIERKPYPPPCQPCANPLGAYTFIHRKTERYKKHHVTRCLPMKVKLQVGP